MTPLPPLDFADLQPLLPELFLLGMAAAILLVDTLLSPANRYISYLLTLATLVGCTWLTLPHLGSAPATALYGMFIEDPLAAVSKLVLYLAVAATLTYARDYLKERNLYRGGFFVLALFSLLGMMVMISAYHFLMLYLGLELMSLSLYALVALQRNSTLASEAAMKYFVLGAIASGMLLYGMSMIYGVTGTLYLGQMRSVLAAGTFPSVPLVFGLVFMVAGMAFKLGVVPFHMWVPDVYQGAPTAVTLFIGSAPKLAGLAFLLRVLVWGLEPLFIDWQQMLVVLAVLSMAIGNITAIAQTNLKRMLAYSTIAHMGFMLLGVLAADRDGYSAALFYAIAYLIMSLAAFGMILLLSRAGFESDRLEDFKGLNARSPWLAFLMLITMFSMAGIPPTVGFYAKLAVLQAVVNQGYLWVAVVAVLFSLVGAYYYLRVVKLMYFDNPEQSAEISAGTDMRLVLSANGLALLLLGILPSPLMNLCLYALRTSL